MTVANDKTKPCPTCGAAAAAKFKPFCSKRCAEVDLGRWFTGRYIIAGEDTAGEDEGQGPADGSL